MPEEGSRPDLGVHFRSLLIVCAGPGSAGTKTSYSNWQQNLLESTMAIPF